MEIQLKEAKGWIAHAQEKQDESASLLRSAAEQEDGLEKRPVTPGPIIPAREQLGELLLELNQGGAALREFEASLANAPRRRGALLGAARAAEMSGDPMLAAKYKNEAGTN